MSKYKLFTEEEFNADNGLKETFGNYSDYSNFMSGVVNKEQPTQPKSRYDTYMDEATRIYNEGVEQNNKTAETQSAQALAQYNEVNRFANELNKATGKANTGYAGDVSIDAYNAYRNSVNQSYANAEKSNNDLYSYYMQEMRNIENEKVAEETATDERNFNKVYGEGGFKDEFEDYIEASPNDVLYDNGNIKPEEAQKWWEYAKSYFGGEENIPEYAIGVLKTQAGFSEWLDAYNNGTTDALATENEKTNIGIDKLVKADANGNVSTEGKDFAVIAGELNASTPVTDVRKDNFKLEYGGETYNLEVSGKKYDATSTIAQTMEDQILNVKGREAKEGDVCYYDGNLYIKSGAGSWQQVEGREWFGIETSAYNRLMRKIKQDLGVETYTEKTAQINQKVNANGNELMVLKPSIKNFNANGLRTYYVEYDGKIKAVNITDLNKEIKGSEKTSVISYMENAYDRTLKNGDAVYYNGNIYIYTDRGNLVKAN